MSTTFLPLSAVLLCSSVALVALWRDAKAFVHRIFALGMFILAAETACTGLSLQARTYTEVIEWQRWRTLIAAFLPSCWLLLSLSFARANAQEFLQKWRWIILGTLIIPLVVVGVGWDSLFVHSLAWDPASRWVLGLGWAGFLFFLLLLPAYVLVLMNIERTLRASTGSQRWHIKFIVLGLGSLLVARIYIGSQILLFSSVMASLEAVNTGAVVVASILMICAFLRTRVLNVSLYLSHTALYYSLSVLLVGVYLLLVGLLAKVVSYVGGERAFALEAFIVFLAVLTLAIFLMSDEWRLRSKRFIFRHFQRPHYDYRREWALFTERTTSLVEIGDVCDVVVKQVSETFGVGCVTLWLIDDAQRLVWGGSTVFSEAEAQQLRIKEKDREHLLSVLQDKQMPVAFETHKDDWAGQFAQIYAEALRQARFRYCAPLTTNRELIGLLTLDQRTTEEPFSMEDFELLKTIADQVAASLLNLRLSQQLVKAKEMEAFQALSTFFVHDLKNVASTLSLTMQNLPVHFDDPDFRTDALRVITNSVNKMNSMCSRLSLLTKGLELQKTAGDLNETINGILADLNGSLRAKVQRDLHPLAPLSFDPEQLQKVLVNLLLNANDAIGSQGQIVVTTEQQNGWAIMAVQDNGAGMPKEFIARSLFQPFQTTKSKGLGIGLFHSKKIVEAHHGRIEVESEQGKGSIFRVFLPLDVSQ
jgi:putative PEP-CTERM system histidine kinase